MKSGVLRRWLIILICLVVPATMVLCCAPAMKPKKISETEILRKRVTEYWALRIKGDLVKNYEYEIPSYREKVALADYLLRQGQMLKFTSAEIREMDVDGNRATVEVFLRFNYQIPNFKIKTSEDSIREKWVKFEGEWYHIPFGFIYQ
jgi:hypothetical protein